MPLLAVTVRYWPGLVGWLVVGGCGEVTGIRVYVGRTDRHTCTLKLVLQGLHGVSWKFAKLSKQISEEVPPTPSPLSTQGPNPGGILDF